MYAKEKAKRDALYQRLQKEKVIHTKKTVICPFYAKGTLCNFGAIKCRYSHDPKMREEHLALAKTHG